MISVMQRTRTLFSLYLLALVPFFAFSQSIERSPLPDRYQSQGEAATYAGTSWFVGGNIGTCLVPVILEIDSNGATAQEYLLEQRFTGWGWGGVTDLDQAADGNIFGAGYGRLYDDVYPQFGTLFKMNLTGGIVWQVKWKDVLMVNGIEELDNGQLIAFTDDQWMRLSPSGTRLDSGYVNFGRINDASKTIGPDYVLATDSGLMVSDTLGWYTTQKNFANPCPAVEVLPNGKILTVSGSWVYSLDSLLQPLDSVNLSIAFTEITEMDFDGLNAYIAGRSANADGWHVQRVSQALSPGPPAFVADELLTPNDVVANANRIFLAGTELIAEVSSAFIKDFEKPELQNVDENTDLAVIGTRIGTYFPNGNYPEIELEVTVQNTGTVPITDFYVSSVGDLAVNCGRNTVHQQYTNQNLQPGDSMVVVLPQFEIFVSPNGQPIRRSCAWTSHPNGRLDKDHRNDSFCDSLLLSVGMEPLLAGPKISLYPQPATGRTVLVVHSAGPWNATLFDLQGRILAEWKSLHQPQLEILQNRNPNGLYLLEVNAPEGTTQHKLWWR